MDRITKNKHQKIRHYRIRSIKEIARYLCKLRYYNDIIHSLIGERSEPHTYRTVGKNLRHIYIYVFYIYIYIYTSVRRARAVNARATRKRRTGRLRFNGQYNRLENGYFSSKL